MNIFWMISEIFDLHMYPGLIYPNRGEWLHRARTYLNVLPLDDCIRVLITEYGSSPFVLTFVSSDAIVTTNSDQSGQPTPSEFPASKFNNEYHVKSTYHTEHYDVDLLSDNTWHLRHLKQKYIYPNAGYMKPAWTCLPRDAYVVIDPYDPHSSNGLSKKKVEDCQHPLAILIHKEEAMDGYLSFRKDIF